MEQDDEKRKAIRTKRRRKKRMGRKFLKMKIKIIGVRRN